MKKIIVLVLLLILSSMSLTEALSIGQMVSTATCKRGPLRVHGAESPRAEVPKSPSTYFLQKKKKYAKVLQKV